jgi:murein DD-endopeptidase MepM/ murein hydrolase activator NlpD
MRPTLAYITSDLGSPGQPHLDVKQQDNPNTPKNEFRGRFNVHDLDNYVVVKDPEFGTIPVGELRKRLPGRGDDFDQHVARGSHGIDYPTAYNTQVFVRNGARVVSKQQTRWGSMVIIQLPDGRRFSFLHGKSV